MGHLVPLLVFVSWNFRLKQFIHILKAVFDLNISLVGFGLVLVLLSIEHFEKYNVLNLPLLH